MASRTRNHRRPQGDTPTVDRLPAERRSIQQGRFTWTSPAGVVVDIPSMGTIPLRTLRELDDITHSDEGLRPRHILLLADTDDGRQAMDQLGSDDLKRLMKAWERDAKRSGLDAGESTASPRG